VGGDCSGLNTVLYVRATAAGAFQGRERTDMADRIEAGWYVVKDVFRKDGAEDIVCVVLVSTLHNRRFHDAGWAYGRSSGRSQVPAHRGRH